MTPAGVRIARWYCPQGHCTFSLIPDFLASHLPGTLDDLERIVVKVEQSRSIESAADALRADDDITLASAVRWVRRRIMLVRSVLAGVTHAIPARYGTCPPNLTAFRCQYEMTSVLPQLRKIGANYLYVLPPPLGFSPRRSYGSHYCAPIQQEMGPDPPDYCV